MRIGSEYSTGMPPEEPNKSNKPYQPTHALAASLPELTTPLPKAKEGIEALEQNLQKNLEGGVVFDTTFGQIKVFLTPPKE